MKKKKELIQSFTILMVTFGSISLDYGNRIYNSEGSIIYRSKRLTKVEEEKVTDPWIAFLSYKNA